MLIVGQQQFVVQPAISEVHAAGVARQARVSDPAYRAMLLALSAGECSAGYPFRVAPRGQSQ